MACVTDGLTTKLKFCSSHDLNDRLLPGVVYFDQRLGCCALQTLVKIAIFNVFCSKKLKKARNLQQNFAKKHVFLSLHQKKNHFFGNKTVDQRSEANFKKPVFANFF